MAGYIDIHTHAFPDPIAKVAIPALEREGGIKAYLDGTVAGLLASMDRGGIEQSVLCSIATRPEQFAPILEWSKEIRSERIVPFPSLHPADPDLLAHLQMIHDEGFKGIKMHSYYQLVEIRLETSVFSSGCGNLLAFRFRSPSHYPTARKH